MPVDRAAERLSQIEIANREGTLNNEQAFRNKIEQFQDRFREKRPSVIDVSTDAEKLFHADLESILALAELSVDREIKNLCFKIVRALQYLDRKEGK